MDLERYYQQLIGYLSIRLCDRNLAADVAHDAYLRVLENTRPEALEYPQAYLYRTARNLVIDQGRRRAARRTDCSEHIEQHAGRDADTPHESLYTAQRLALMQRAIGELSESCRTAFLLRKLEGLAHPEIAARMGISKDMVEKHIVNAMKHCRLRVKEMEYSKADADDAAKRFRSASPLPPLARR